MRTIQRDIAGAFIFSKDNKLLLGKTLKGGVYEGTWVVPGGGVEAGESKIEALKREIHEELGLIIEDSQIEALDEPSYGESKKTLRDTQEEVFVKMIFWDFKIYLDEVADNVKLSFDDDMSEAVFFALDELPKLKLGGGTQGTLTRLGYLK